MYHSPGPIAGSSRSQPATHLGTNPAMTSAEFFDRLRVTTEFLEAIVADRGLLAGGPPDDQRRLLQAAGHVYAPDATPADSWCAPASAGGRPRRCGARTRSSTRPASGRCAGSRSSPRPTSFRPDFEARDTTAIRTSGKPSSRSTATSASRSTPTIHHFYDQLCPACAEFNFAKRTELADLRGPGGAAHRRAGEDRLPGRPQAAAGRRAADRHHPLSPRLGGALRRASRTSASGATGSRSSGSTCATRRASRRSAASCSRPATGSTSSSTTPARPCAGRRSSTST